MTLANANNYNDATGNGTTNQYSFTFKIFASSELQVTLRHPTTNVEQEIALTTDYTVPASSVNNPNGGTITLVDSDQAWLDASGFLDDDWIIAIRRVRPLTQSTSIRNQSTYFAGTHEDMFDKLVMNDQQQQNEINRSIKLPETEDPSDYEMLLPVEEDRASKVLAFDAEGDVIAQASVPTSGVLATSFVETLLDDTSAANFLTTLGFSSFFQTLIDDTTAVLTRQTLLLDKKGADILSATTINLDTSTGDLVDVTGTTQIDAITLAEGVEKTVRFTGALTLNHGASLILPNATDITTAAGDFAVFRGYASGVVRLVNYSALAGAPSSILADGSVTDAKLEAENMDLICHGRLTTETGVAISTSDRATQSTIYFTPFKGNRIDLYNGTRWLRYTFTEKSLALSGLTSGKNYDVFIYDNSGTLTLELSAAWTNDTTRADALTTQDGIYVKSGALTRRYLGTLRTTGTNSTEDKVLQRYIWNYYNRVEKVMKATDATNDWSYNTNTWRQARATTANKVEYVVGLSEDIVRAKSYAVIDQDGVGTGDNMAVGVGLDSVTANSAVLFGTRLIDSDASGRQGGTAYAEYAGYPGIGYHYLAWLEIGPGSATTTWYGDGGADEVQSGIMAQIQG